MSYMKRHLEDLIKKGEFPKNHIIEPGGSIGFHGKGYPPESMFHNVDIQLKNNKNYPIEIRLNETGLSIELVRKN